MGQTNIKQEQNNKLAMQLIYQPEYINITHSISILTYNVLAACYCDKNVFRYVDDENLYFAHRAKKLIDQLKILNSDIICLQELDHLDFYQKHFQQLEYDIYFTQRPNRADGCAILFKSQKFSLLKSTNFSLDKLAQSYGLTLEYQRQNVFQIIKLEYKINKKQIVVGNIHTYWNPNQDDLKYFQMVNMVQKMESEKESDDEMLVFCGDFNSLPHSNPIQYVFRKEPSADRIEKSNTQIKLMKELYQRFGVPKLNWQSAYDPFPKFSNYTKDFKGCIDYIFYHNASVQKVLKTPDQKFLDVEVALPNSIFPSDHLPLLAIFDIH